MLIDKEALAAAVRECDRVAEQIGFEEAVEMAGLDPKAAMYLAQQRALRMILLERGRNVLERVLASGEYEIVNLTQGERDRRQVYMLVWLDGVVAGARAAKDRA